MPLLNILQNDFFTQMYAVCMSIHINFIEIEVLVARSNLCNPMDCSPPGSSVHGILQARVLEWVAISFSRGSSQPRDRTWAAAAAAKSLRSSQTLCNRTDGSPPGSPVPAISCTAGRYVQIYVNTHTYYNEKQRA